MRLQGDAHVLVVDYDLDTCQGTSVMLRGQGYRVTWAKSPEDALNLVHEGQFDIILLSRRCCDS
jgi:CheY-like chemotaxis protein